jgi:hypothetical protein
MNWSVAQFGLVYAVIVMIGSAAGYIDFGGYPDAVCVHLR